MKYEWHETPYLDEINDGCLQLRVKPETNAEMAWCERAFALQRTRLTYTRSAFGDSIDYCISFDKPAPTAPELTEIEKRWTARYNRPALASTAIQKRWWRSLHDLYVDYTLGRG